MCHTLNYLGAARDIFWTRMKGFFRGCDMNTYGDWQLSLAGAQQSIDSAVEQLVIMETDVTGIPANHHRVFFRQQVQIARSFLCQEVKKKNKAKNSHQTRGGQLKPAQITFIKTKAALKWHAGTFARARTHTRAHTHRRKANSRSITQLRKPAENSSTLGSTSD